jgi:hypothetical protein
MSKFFTLVICTLCALTTLGQNNIPDPSKKLQVVEVACGQCKFGLPGTSCDLAVRIDGKFYFVDGTTIDEQGDAHAKDGFYKAIRKAEVQGEIENGRFKASYFELIKKAC